MHNICRNYQSATLENDRPIANTTVAIYYTRTIARHREKKQRTEPFIRQLMPLIGNCDPNSGICDSVAEE
jgi:hypothetical protein